MKPLKIYLDVTKLLIGRFAQEIPITAEWRARISNLLGFTSEVWRALLWEFFDHVDGFGQTIRVGGDIVLLYQPFQSPTSQHAVVLQLTGIAVVLIQHQLFYVIITQVLTSIVEEKRAS